MHAKIRQVGQQKKEKQAKIDAVIDGRSEAHEMMGPTVQTYAVQVARVTMSRPYPLATRYSTVDDPA